MPQNEDHTTSRADDDASRHARFEGRIVELEAMIETLPEEARPGLRELAAETRRRHGTNTDNLEQARRSLRVLELTEQLAALNMQLLVDTVKAFEPEA